ncbi:hypothetical protein V2154_10995 [Ewingella sp. CoE-038-23]|uniref:hypothetical protein n=1 Tax=Ewingella docleensis TaxID=3118588 RepID=UPI003365A13B
MINKNIITFFLLIPILMGCRSSISYEPNGDYLPSAKFKQSYYSEVNILGGPVIGRLVTYKITPINSGLNAFPGEYISRGGDKISDYNIVIIKGVPISTSDIEIEIYGSTYGTNHPGKEFNKTYKIKVVN